MLNTQIFYENIAKMKNITGAALIIYHNEHSPENLKFQLQPSNLDVLLHYWLDPDCPSISRLIERHSTCCQQESSKHYDQFAGEKYLIVV